MNSSKYQDILAQNLLASVRKLKMRRNFTFQHDNAPKHTSKSTKAWLHQSLEWPIRAQTSIPSKTDLKRAVHRRSPRNLKELEFEWDNNPKSRCANLTETSRRLAAAINAKGASTRHQLDRLMQSFKSKMFRIMNYFCLEEDHIKDGTSLTFPLLFLSLHFKNQFHFRRVCRPFISTIKLTHKHCVIGREMEMTD